MSQIKIRIESSSVRIRELRECGAQLEALNSKTVVYKAGAERIFEYERKRQRALSRPVRGGKRHPIFPARKGAEWVSTVVYVWDTVNFYISKYPLASAIAGICLKKIYDTCTKWARKRKREAGAGVRMHIFGPEGNVLRVIDVGKPRVKRR